MGLRIYILFFCWFICDFFDLIYDVIIGSKLIFFLIFFFIFKDKKYNYDDCYCFYYFWVLLKYKFI